VAQLAREIGFTQISVSHQVSPLMKLISRGDTTVVDAYLSPILQRYVKQVAAELSSSHEQLPRLMFMQSNGGLTEARSFRGKDSILSGPAGGIVGVAQTSKLAGLDKIISFDMGGTSTDVAHYAGEYERTFETEVAGVRLRSPMMSIHTVAAGGGSLLRFDGARYRVGPESAGANPGPACYRKGGELTVTDCNLMLGKVQPEFFPKVFGAAGDLPLDSAIVQQKFTQLAAEITAATGETRTAEQVAQGFLTIAVEKMANAIKKISVQRGYDITTYTLCSFGGAGGQHACLIADALGMRQIFLHPFAGVLSAYGMGLAHQTVIQQRAIEATLTNALLPQLAETVAELAAIGQTELQQQGIVETEIQVVRKLHLRYQGTDAALVVDLSDRAAIVQQFEQIHRQRYGFITPEKSLIVEAVAVEVVGLTTAPTTAIASEPRPQPLQSIATVQTYLTNSWQPTPVYDRADLRPGDRIPSPALIIEPTSTIVLEPGWQAEVTPQNDLLLKKSAPTIQNSKFKIQNSNLPDPVLLEIFNHLFMAIAEQMGFTLQNTSYSVNIKERLDFSCAIFDHHGQLVANAPHIPVHLGSMSDSVQSLIVDRQNTFKPGDVYASNNPYNGGTHLPDVTVITPVFAAPPNLQSQPLFFVAARGHHADIGGITPGSMPPNSMTIAQEGVLLDNFQLVEQGRFCESELLQLLTSSAHPVRNPAQNLADLQAQIAANKRGGQELHKMVAQFGLATVQAYMQHVQDNAEAAVRRVIDTLEDGEFSYAMDDGAAVRVKVSVDRAQRTAKIDFTGTSPQQPNNFNAPLAVCKAAVLYVFRTLVDEDIPLNAGCLKPLEIIVPEGCLLNPHPPAAVVAGNVETSQVITDALYGALGSLAASQGTMNNFTFGNSQHQYYETICGGSGAGATFAGTDAVQTHMTNSRLTDPEVLEWRFPVRLETFAIRSHSGGAGFHHGGNGVVRRLQFLEPMTAAILSGHRQVAPFGLQGGESGTIGRNWVKRSQGTIEPLGSKAEVQMQPGDVFGIETPGGGGYGNPT
jgi:5-oxoprolinase (ATP-hydrolysing)